MQSRPIRIGTRGSPLALYQAHEVRDRLRAAHGLDEAAFEIVVIKTTGDRITDKALREFGGKGLFTKEIEEALIDGRIHMAVHSMKDMPTELPQSLEIACLLEREDVRDAFLSPKAQSIQTLPKGAVVGTASLRRQGQVKRLRPDLEVVTFRGAVETRLRKLEAGEVDATLLAYSGLRRLGLEDVITSVVAPDDMLPAVAQGAIGIEIRSDDLETRDLLAAIHHEETATRIAAERAFLAALDGSCRTPIAALAECIDDNSIRLRGMVLAPDGSAAFETEREGPNDAAASLGAEAGRQIIADAGLEFLANLKADLSE